MKFQWNKNYTTISVYTIIVFIICYSIFKLTNNWTQTQEAFLDLIHLLSPFFFSFLIAYFISPLLDFWERTIFSKIRRFSLRRTCSIVFSYLLVLGFIIILLSFIIPQLATSAQDMANVFKNYPPAIEAILNSDRIPIFHTQYYIDMTIVGDYLNSNIENSLSSLSSMFQNLAPVFLSSVKTLASTLLNILFGFIIAIYILINKEKSLVTARKVTFALFPHRYAIRLINLAKESNEILLNFLIGKLVDSLIIGIICFITLNIFDFPYALMLSVIVGITNIIPYFGPFIGGIIGFLLLLLVNPIKALWFILFILILQQFDGNILGPKILGTSTGLSPFWVIFSILLFGHFFGFVGMFFGVPISAIVRILMARQIDRLYTKRLRGKP